MNIEIKTERTSESRSKIIFDYSFYNMKGDKFTLIKGIRDAYSLPSSEEAKNIVEEMLLYSEIAENAKLGKDPTVMMFFLNIDFDLENFLRSRAFIRSKLTQCGANISSLNPTLKSQNPCMEVALEDCEDYLSRMEFKRLEQAIVSAATIAMQNGQYEVAAKLNQILILDFAHET